MAPLDRGDIPDALAAYERLRSAEGPDPSLLAEVAAVLLEEEARGGDPPRRRAAIAELVLAGPDGSAALDRLAAASGPDPARASALAALSARGHRGARAVLRRFLAHRDSEVLAQAVTALDPRTEARELIEHLTHDAPAVRRAAAALLEEAAPSVDGRAALSEAARQDPDPAVRSAAANSLSAYGDPAFEALRDRLSDEHPTVRMTAVGALARANLRRALAVITPFFETPPSPAGIEAARILGRAAHGEDGVTTARAYLRRALEVADASLRSQAAVALMTLPADPSLEAALFRALETEADASVRLAIARVLYGRPSTGTAARDALRALQTEDGMVGIQAAIVLAPSASDDSVAVLLRGLAAADPALRRVAGRALARDALRPDATRAALSDPDPLVRIRTAGGILAAGTRTAR
jgi:HEAT repeat protein